MTTVPVVASSSVIPAGTAPQAGTPGGTATITYASGVQVGDVLLLAAVNGVPDANSTPPGWVSLKTGTSPPSSSDTTANVYWKVAALADTTATTVAVTHTAGGTADVPIGAMVRIDSASVAQPTKTQVSIGSASSTSGPTITALSPAPIATDLVVRFYFVSTNSAAAYTAMASPTGWTLLQKQFTNHSSDFNCGIVVAALLAGTGAPTMTCAPTSGWVVIDVAVPGATPTVGRSYNQSVPRAAYH